jgi:hypothetical protein
MLSKFLYSPTNAQVNCLKTIIKFTLKLALKQLRLITLASSNNALPDDGMTAPKHVGAVLMLILMLILKLFLTQFTCASVGQLKNTLILSICCDYCLF